MEPIARKKDLISMYRDALVRGFVNILVFFDKLVAKFNKFSSYLIQLWWQCFQIFVYGDVVYAQTWEVLTLKNCIEPPYVAESASGRDESNPVF